MPNQVLKPEIIAEAVSANYDVDQPTHCELIRAGFNHNYRVETSDGVYVLRAYLNGKYYIKDADDFRFELEFTNFLLSEGLPVVRPIAAKSGDWLGAIETETEVRHTALFHLAPGIEFDEASKLEGFGEAEDKHLGKLIALMHQAADSFQGQHHRYHQDVSTYLLDKSLQILETHLANHNMGDVAFLYPYAEQFRQQVKALPRAAPTYGLIHCDLHGQNIFSDKAAGFTIIDFDHCAYGWRIYDIAGSSGNPQIFNAVLSGYESVRPMSDIEKQLAPTFAKFREIWDIGDILYYMPLWGEDVSEAHLEECVKRLKALMT